MHVLFTAPKPAISPLELIAVANNRNNGEFAGTSVFRSLITPFCQRNARGFPSVVKRRANHFASVVNPRAAARHVLGKRAEVPHTRPLGPQERVNPKGRRAVCRRRRRTNHLTLVIDRQSQYSRPPRRGCRGPWTEPSFSQSTACGPYAIGGSTVFAHVPDAPTAWPLSLIQRAIPTVSPGSGLKFPDLPLPWPPDHGFKVENLRPGAVECHSQAGTPDPECCSPPSRPPRPRLLIWPTVLLLPPSVGSGQYAALPHVRQAFEARAVTAEVFIIWIFGGAFAPEPRSGPFRWRQTLHCSVQVCRCQF